ncbi:MAG TPA: hypothetical protein VGN54_13965 [Mycobacteriales bacterium]|nr:hypothetical protein [Mycobacteriales bacterium]
MSPVAGTPGSTRTILEAVRGVYGGLQLTAPGLLAGRLLSHPLDRHERGVARVLAGRQLGQALLSGTRPGPRALVLGAGVDLLHAASMLGLGLISRRHRRAALTDAIIASSFAAGGAWAARTSAATAATKTTTTTRK